MKYKYKALFAVELPLAAVFIAGSEKYGRNHFNEPFDLLDHMGNVFATLPMAVVTVGNNLEEIEDPTRTKRNKAFIIGAIMCTAANLLVETKFGTRIFESIPVFGHKNTPDMIDAMYGAPAGILASFIISRLHPGKPQL